MAPQQSTAQLKTAPGEELQRWIRDRASFQPGDLLGREWRFRQLRVLVIRAEQVRDVAHPLVEDRPILSATGIEHGRARPVLRDQRAELGVVDAGEVFGGRPERCPARATASLPAGGFGEIGMGSSGGRGSGDGGGGGGGGGLTYGPAGASFTSDTSGVPSVTITAVPAAPSAGAGDSVKACLSGRDSRRREPVAAGHRHSGWRLAALAHRGCPSPVRTASTPPSPPRRATVRSRSGRAASSRSSSHRRRAARAPRRCRSAVTIPPDRRSCRCLGQPLSRDRRPRSPAPSPQAARDAPRSRADGSSMPPASWSTGPGHRSWSC